jgi:hypothetical protein
MVMDDEAEQKKAFAAEWLRNPDAFKAALAVVGTQDAGRALFMSNNWVIDPLVLQLKAELLDEHGAKAFLPTKEEFARSILDLAEVARATEDKLKALRLFGEVMGFIEKPTTNINNNVVTANRVMVINQKGDDASWEARLLKQQQGLAHVASKH